jgi:hypothetical protein
MRSFSRRRVLPSGTRSDLTNFWFFQGCVERVWCTPRRYGIHEAYAAKHCHGILPVQRFQSGLRDYRAVNGYPLLCVAGRPVRLSFFFSFPLRSLSIRAHRKYTGGGLPPFSEMPHYEDFALDAQAVMRTITEEIDRQPAN